MGCIPGGLQGKPGPSLEISSLGTMGGRGGTREGGAAAEVEGWLREEVGEGECDADGLTGSDLTSSRAPLAPPVVAAAGALPPVGAAAGALPPAAALMSARPLSAEPALGRIGAP